METTILSSSILPPLFFSPLKQHKKLGHVPMKRSKGKTLARRRSESLDWDCRGRLVDENMIVLRKRIHEMKVIERNYEPPEDWMQWEKQYYASYDELICKLVGFLQSQLMNTRPSVALGMLMLIVMSVPVSTTMVLSHLIAAANSVLPAVHLG